MDINIHRDIIIKFHGLRNVDDVYTFYYDESNNNRKLYLTDTGLNVAQDNNFVLAGVMHKGTTCPVDFSPLFTDLKLQSNLIDLKLKHVAKGDFLDVLKSEKLGKILDWLYRNNFYIHYFNLNILYWSIVDIIDSILEDDRNAFYALNHMLVKSDLYEVVKQNKEEFLSGLKRYEYPDVNKSRFEEFILWIMKFLDSNNSILSKERAFLLKKLFENSLDTAELPLITGFHKDELIGDFFVFYLRTVYLFKNANHIFDEEPCIQKLFAEFPLTDNGKPFSNYKFARSQDVKAIQICDVISGLLGKYFNFIKDTDKNDIKRLKENLTKSQLSTLMSLKSLIDVSHDLCEGLFHSVASQEEYRKSNWFLHGVGTL